MASKSKVYFLFHDVNFDLKQRKQIKSLVELIFKRQGYDLDEMNFIFCSDEYLLKINQRFLQHDFYTDIITFRLSNPSEAVRAEAYISLDRVKENARLGGVPVQEELRRVIFHGALHLCGFNDKSPKEISAIRKEENQLLTLLRRRISRKTVSK